MIVVFGATGTVGRQVVAALAARGEPVRAFVRDPARASFGSGVERAVGDLGRPDSVRSALAGADRVFMVSAGPDALVHDRTVAAEVRHAGVRHVVKVSSVAALPPVGDAYGGQQAAAERVFTRCGAGWTFLRPAAFMSNVLQWSWSITAEDTVYVPFGHIARALVDPRDVSEAAVTALTSPGHEGRAYTLTGPEALTAARQTEAIGRALGRRLRCVDAPPSAARKAMADAGIPAAYADGVLASLGDPDPARGGTVLPTVERLLGRPAGTFASWLAEHVAEFSA
ncbi:NAD(P)H-binding protein [Streptomyces sp. NPDC001404]|uniref:NAD(P)H-binding protein n=1 Tax=Streptomyces sp. NPDC001404 TaxID=3364571 RepID=UPI003696C608